MRSRRAQPTRPRHAHTGWNALVPIIFVGRLLGGCSLAYDFDDIDGLRCPCQDGYVCIDGACEPSGQVDDFAPCRPDVDDAQCRPGARCTEGTEGAFCLPSCARANFGASPVPDACVAGTVCRPRTSDAATVCMPSACDVGDNRCGVGRVCVLLNGAGVCVAPCDPFATEACLGDEACHPIGASGQTACIPAGETGLGAACTDTPCARRSAEATPRPLVCTASQADSDAILRCRPACVPSTGYGCMAGETCATARPGATTASGAALGVCVTP